MKIGIVCPYDIYGGGGVQECVLALYSGLINRGHKVKIITPRPIDVPKDRNAKDIIFVGRARPVKVAQTSNQMSISISNEEINDMLETESFDVIHFHEPWIPVISLQIMSRSSAVHIATFHAAMSERLTSKTIEKIITPYTKSIFKYIDVMTAVSPTATNYVSSLTDRNIEIIPNGIDLKKYKNNNNLSTRKKTIFYIGRIEKRKGLKYLLSAFQLLYSQDPEFELVIGGTGPELEKLKMQVERDGLKNVKFLDYYVPEKDKIKYLNQSAIYCTPAIHGESFGIVLLEAMATGCVIVAGNNQGYASVLKDLGQISLVDPKNSEEFANRLKLLADNDQLRDILQKWGYEEVKKYDYENIIDQYENLYEKSYKENSKK